MNDTKSPYRPKRSPKLARAVQAVYDLVHGKCSEDDRAFLESDILLWLRAIRIVSANTENMMRMRVVEVDQIKPDPGEGPNRRYLDALKLLARRKQSHMHNLAVLRVMRDELTFGLGAGSAHEIADIGQVIGWFNDILYHLEQDNPDLAKLVAMRSLKAMVATEDSGCTLEDDLEDALQIIEDTVDDEECEFDHHGHCQMHSWPNEEECPNARGIRLLAKYEEDDK